jgi:hypothetical protein
MNKYLNLKQNTKQTLSKAEQDKLNFALAELFFGLSRANLTRASNLGVARQKALEQIGAYLESKDANNPAVQYMYRAYMANKAKWAKAIMTSTKSENAVNLQKEDMKKNEASGAKWVNEALNKLNAKIKEFEPRTNTYAQAQEMVKGKMQQQAEAKKPKAVILEMKPNVAAAEKPEGQAVIIELQNAELSREQVEKLIRLHLQKAYQNAA